MRTSRSPAATATAPRARPAKSATRVAGRWTCSSRTCPPRRRCGAWLTKYSRGLPGSTCWSTTSGASGTPDTSPLTGSSYTFALNHLAPFLLTNLLLDRLKQSAPARVVMVASHAQALGRIDFDDLQGERSYSGARAYNQSKLANVLFTYALARRLTATSVTVNALHPGVVRTSFGAEDPALVQRLLIPFVLPFMKAPAQGAATSIHLASAPDLEQVTGGYFANSKPKRSSERSYDEAVAARLWQVSADLVGLTPVGAPTARNHHM